MLNTRGDTGPVREARHTLNQTLSDAIHARARGLDVNRREHHPPGMGVGVGTNLGPQRRSLRTVLFGRMQSDTHDDRASACSSTPCPRASAFTIAAPSNACENCKPCWRSCCATNTRPWRSPNAAAPYRPNTLVLRTAQLPAIGSGHEQSRAVERIAGDIDVLSYEERTNYRTRLSVDDRGEDFLLTAQTTGGVARACVRAGGSDAGEPGARARRST